MDRRKHIGAKIPSDGAPASAEACRRGQTEANPSPVLEQQFYARLRKTIEAIYYNEEEETELTIEKLIEDMIEQHEGDPYTNCTSLSLRTRLECLTRIMHHDFDRIEKDKERIRRIEEKRNETAKKKMMRNKMRREKEHRDQVVKKEEPSDTMYDDTGEEDASLEDTY